MTTKKTDAQLLATQLRLMKKGAGINYLYTDTRTLAVEFIRVLRGQDLTLETFSQLEAKDALRIAEDFMTKIDTSKHLFPTEAMVAAAGIVATRKTEPEKLKIMRSPKKQNGGSQPKVTRPFTQRKRDNGHGGNPRPNNFPGMQRR